MRRRALLASASATQSDINPEFAFEWHLQYPGEGSVEIYAKDDENVVKAFDTLLRIHEALGANLDDFDSNSPSIPREFNLTVNGVRLTSSYYDDTLAQMYTSFSSASNVLVSFGQMTRDIFRAAHI